ncbi:major facilitator superfamily domain-containing protein [Boeremia exigua]|uniref:major facilitator superfamily domain-containing protein n=1 Tax=Boeremia exigua TaxID=749465 RepID=UPI001E8E4AA7|nr:major facilitator superfamily domain-containing protein [Boeremia exigua]KAH6621971.1 major facilitator superfamily domain-containing protein [Boeremia exigua]
MLYPNQSCGGKEILASDVTVDSASHGHSQCLSEKCTGTSIVEPPPSTPAEDDADDGDDTRSISGQRNTMSAGQLRIAIPTLSVCLFVSFIDQTSVSTATPAIAGDLNTGTATSWIGTSFLIASTAFQLINGRLSDIFGRKGLLLLCLALLGLGDLGCGFAQTAEQLFVLRAIAGIGGGGINSLVMIIVSDITTLQNRGKYQGWLGSVIALGNGIGPFLGGAVVEGGSWRWVFWMIPIMTLPTTVVLIVFLPLKHTSSDTLAKMKQIDYGGIALNIASTLLLLIPLSGGGLTYAWSSAFFIGATVTGAVLTLLFVLYEWKLAPLPIMPLRLYRAPHCWALYLQSFLTGLAYFGNFFYLPIYFQSILRYSPLVSGALILPLVISTSFASIASGYYMTRVGSYMHCILLGFILWTVGNGLTLILTRQNNLAVLIVALVVEGAGIGLTLQPTLVGMYANSRTSDRAVTTGLRNFIRTIGGAFGLVVSGVVLANTLRQRLLGVSFVSDGLLAALTSSTYALDDLDLAPAQRDQILDAYMLGLRYIFVFFTCCSGLSLLLTLGVGNTSLKAAKPAEDEESGIEPAILGQEIGTEETKTVEKTDTTEKMTAGQKTHVHPGDGPSVRS